MAYTTGNAVRDILSELGQLTEGKATGGTTASVIDTLLGGADDDWNGGTVLIARDSDGASAAPEGQFAIVTDYTGSTTGNIAVAAGGFTVAPAAGDIYGVATAYYPLRQVLRGLNRGLSALGDIPLTDIATLTTAAAQTEYTYAVAWKRRPPFRVDIQGKLSDTNDYQWKEIAWWEYVPATAGSTGLLILKQQPPSGYLLRIWYLSPHPNVEAYSDVIYEGFHPELVVWKSVYEVLIWQHGRSQGTDASVVQMLNKAEQQIFKLEATQKPWMPKRKTKLMVLTGNRDKDEFTHP
jgi:hypothetical protein